MQYRARVIGATFNLQSRPGSGTHILCLFQPISAEPAPEPEKAKTTNSVNVSGRNTRGAYEQKPG